jgi:hypothetical protein
VVLRRHRTRLHRIAAKTHKWLAIIVGIQLLLWFSSGALMSFLPIAQVRGEHLVDRTADAPLIADFAAVAPAKVAQAAGVPVTSLTYRMLLGRPVVEIATAKGTRLADTATGAMLPPLTPAQAEAVARAAWRGGGRPNARVERVERASPEYRGALPAWRVAFADSDATNVFVASGSGQISAVRTRNWRLYDFFWGLHIMDWKNHADFNTPWLVAFALGGLALWLAGAVLLWMRWPVRRRRGPSPIGPSTEHGES